MATAHKPENAWQPSAFKRYGVAVLAVALTLGARLALDPMLGPHAPYLPFAIAVIVASRYGGRGPGLAATALSALGVEYFFIEPRYSFAVADLNAAAGLALSVVVGVIVSLLVGQLRQSLISSRRVEETLRESEERFRNLFESMDEGFASCEMIYDDAGQPIDFRYLAVNPAFGRLTGLPAEKVVGHRVREVIPEIEPFWIETYGRIVRSGNSERIDNPVASLGKHFELFAWRSGPGRFAVVFSDVTQRKQAEESLRRQALLVNLSHDAIIVMDANRVTQAWNAGAAEVYGWTEAEALGNTTHRFLQTRSFVSNEEVDAVLAREGRWDGELVHTRRDGRQIAVDSRQVLLRDAAGAPVGILEINRDITGRKVAEDMLRRLNATLEWRVRDRTAQLEASNQELEAFAYSVSHDLRAPLRGIDGWSLALKEDYGSYLDGRASEYLDRVRAEAQRMGRLIDDLLQLSRVTRAEMEHEPVDLTGLAGAIAARLREAHPGRNLDFIIHPALTAPGDTRLLEVALTNLLDNAVKFTLRRAMARIEFGETTLDGERVFFVSDNGVGFDVSYAGNLFGAFQRMHKASDFPGTGIGLATTQRIIRRHGGRIWAEAEIDRGASFYFTIPVEPEQETK